MTLPPVDIDVILQLPIPIYIRWPDSDIVGIAAGGDKDKIVLDRAPDINPIGSLISIWPDGVEHERKISDWNADTLTVTVSHPWAMIAEATPATIHNPGTPAEFLIPKEGTTYAIQVKEKIDLPRLGVEGLLPWIDEITIQRQNEFRDAAKVVGIDKKEQLDIEFAARMNLKAVPADLDLPLRRPEGIRRVLTMSLAKTSLPTEKQSRVLEHLMLSPAAGLIVLALSSLYFNSERRAEPKEAAKAAALAAARKIFRGLKDDTTNPTPGPAEISQPASGQDTTTTG